MSKAKKPRVLIICTHLHMDRAHKREVVFLQPMAGLHVASLIDAEKYDIKLYHESYHGIYDITQPDAADIVFLSGLQKDFDRMRQLSYVFQRQGAIVVAGGNLCTVFPEFSAQFFNVIAAGGVECTLSIMRDFEAGNLQTIYRSPQKELSDYIVKHELLTANGIHSPVHFVEASRGCNFKCDFCALPAEGADIATYKTDIVAQTIERAIDTSPTFSLRRRYPLLLFIDNNFSSTFSFMKEICNYLRTAKKVKGWAALVTQNILHNREMISILASAKCRVLFVGIESFNQEFLKQHNKKQNTAKSNNIFDDIRFAQKQGIVVIYPYMFDPRIASVADMKKELEMFLTLDQLTFPDFFTTVSPLVGTQLFWESVEKDELLPNLRLRDLDGQTLAFKNVKDSQEAYSQFYTQLFTDTLSLFNRRKFIGFLAKNALKIGLHRPVNMALYVLCSLNHVWDAANNARPIRRNYIGGRDVLDPQYEQYPADISAEDKAKYFDPIEITDSNGQLSAWLQAYRPNTLPLVKQK